MGVCIHSESKQWKCGKVNKEGLTNLHQISKAFGAPFPRARLWDHPHTQATSPVDLWLFDKTNRLVRCCDFQICRQMFTKLELFDSLMLPAFRWSCAFLCLFILGHPSNFISVKSFWIPASGIIDFIQAPTACSNCRKSQCITGRLGSAKGQWWWTIWMVIFFPHLWLFRIHGLFFFFRGDWVGGIKQIPANSVGAPAKADLMSNSPAARTVFAILEVGFEAAEEGMSRSCLWLCWGGIGVFSRSTWQRKVSCISGCIDEWGQRRSLWGLWKCLSFVIKFRPLCRIFCEHSQLPKPPLPCLAGVYAIVIVTLSWRRRHHHYHRHYPYHCYAYQLPYDYPLH